MYYAEYNIAVCGARGVGKTSFGFRLAYDEFHEDYSFLVDYHVHEPGAYRKRIRLPDTPEEHTITASCYEIASDHSDTLLAHHCARDTAFMIMFSVESRSSFQAAREYHERIVAECKGPTAAVVLVGNKCDQLYREIPADEARELAGELGCAYFEMSAKVPRDVDEPVLHLIRAMQALTANSTKAIEIPDGPAASMGCGCFVS